MLYLIKVCSFFSIITTHKFYLLYEYDTCIFSKYSLNAAVHKEREANAQAAAALAAQQQLAQQQLAQQQLAQQQLAQQQLAQQQLAQQQLLAQQNSAVANTTVQQKQVIKTQKSVSPPVVNGSIVGSMAVQAHLQSQTNVPVLVSE